MTLNEEKESRIQLVEETINNLHKLKAKEIEKTVTQGFETISQAHEFTKFSISIQVALVALGIPFIASGKQIDIVFVFSAATVFFLNIIIGILLLRRDISYELDFNSKHLDDIESNIDEGIKKLQDLKNSVTEISNSDFKSGYNEIMKGSQWAKTPRDKFNWDLLFYGFFVLGLILLWLAIIWNPIILPALKI